jgi:hypothetical protein
MGKEVFMSILHGIRECNKYSCWSTTAVTRLVSHKFRNAQVPRGCSHIGPLPIHTMTNFLWVRPHPLNECIDSGGRLWKSSEKTICEGQKKHRLLG